MDNRGLAGAFMFVGGVQFAIGMVLAEIFYLISILIGLSGLGALGVGGYLMHNQ